MEFLITVFIAVLYFKWLLPYYLNNIEKEIPEDILKRVNYDFINDTVYNNSNDTNNTNYIYKREIYDLTEKMIQNCINYSNYSELLIFDKINNTNNIYYIQQ
jgi:hypothetical protein